MAAGDVTLTMPDTQFCFCVAGSLSPADAGTDWREGTPTTVALTLGGLADTAGRQSLKVDLGANRPEYYAVQATIDFTGETPTAGTMDFYWAPSNIVTQGSGNVYGNSGADAAAPDGAVGATTIAQFIAGCEQIGTMPTTVVAAVQNAQVAVFSPSSRFGQLVVVNNSGDLVEAGNVNDHVVFTPILRNVAQS